MAEQNKVLVASHGSVWLIGLLFIGFGGRKIHCSLSETIRAEAEVRTLNHELEERVRKRTEELKEKEERFRLTVNTAADGIIIINARGVIDTFNAAAEEIFGYKSEEVLGKNVTMLMPMSYAEGHDGYLLNHLQTGERKIIGASREVEGLRKNGETFPLYLALSKTETDGVVLFSAICRDLSREKTFQKELLDAKRSAETANLAKSEFLASMSHELRTPLNSIIGFSQILGLRKNNNMSANQLEQVEQINSAGQHLLSLINDILDLSRIETQGFSLSTEPVSLEEVIKKSIALIAATAKSHDVHIFNECDFDDVPAVLADRVRLKQVLVNLLSNGAKYNRKGGHLTISCEALSDKVKVIISDTGQGIAQEDLEALFEPFNRLGQEAGEIEGTGIGLSITRKIMEMMQGEIGVESELGIGSTFWISLPIIPRPEEPGES